MNIASLPVAVIGAGPIGLAAAAHLLGRGIDPLILERGPGPGHAVLQWRHVRLFSPWRYNIDGAARALLEAQGWQAPEADALPSGGELVEQYLAPLADAVGRRAQMRFNAEVTSVSRRDFDKVRTRGRESQPFQLRIAGPEGESEVIAAKAVIDASGTWFHPNPIGANGLPVPGEGACREHIRYGIPDVLGSQRDRYANRRTLVVGSGHSALNALLDLVKLKDSAPETEILWGVRREGLGTRLGGGEADGLPERGAIGLRVAAAVRDGNVQLISRFHIREVSPGKRRALSLEATIGPDPARLGVDEIIGATGFRPELDMLREVRTRLDGWLESVEQLAPLIDPNIHSCGTVRPHGARELVHPESDFFIAGMKSYGRASSFLLATGYEQVRSLAAALAGDWQAAEQVQLELPETGVCNADAETGGGCCGPTPASDVTRDERAGASSCCG